MVDLCPAQYKKETPAALMIFQDGHSYRDIKGRFRVPIVFDNLIAAVIYHLRLPYSLIQVMKSAKAN